VGLGLLENWSVFHALRASASVISCCSIQLVAAPPLLASARFLPSKRSIDFMSAGAISRPGWSCLHEWDRLSVWVSNFRAPFGCFRYIDCGLFWDIASHWGVGFLP